MVRVAGIDYDADMIREHRNLIIELRDEALRQDDFEWAVNLSNTVALLAEFANLIEGETP